MHRPNHNDEQTWDWLERGHIDHDGLCAVCGSAWPCPAVSLAPYSLGSPQETSIASPTADERAAVYGYVRTAQRGQARIWHWRTELQLFCDQAGLRLVRCFCDVGGHQVASTPSAGFSGVRPYVATATELDDHQVRGYSLSPTARQLSPALRVLLSILEQRTVYGLVVPSIFHLATDRSTAIALMHHIERLGAKVMVVPANGNADMDAHSRGSHTLLDTSDETHAPAPNSHQNGSRR